MGKKSQEFSNIVINVKSQKLSISVKCTITTGCTGCKPYTASFACQDIKNKMMLQIINYIVAIVY